MKIDSGKWEKRYDISFPNEAQIEERFHDKTPNPDIITIRCGTLVFKLYKGTGKGFVYGEDKIFSGSFERHDLKHLYCRIGNIFREKGLW